MLSAFNKTEYFSCFDAQSAFFQVELSEEAKDITAFNTHGLGQFRYLRMPQGLTNSPATFQRVMDMALAGVLWDSVLVFLDDVIVYSPDLETHLRDLRRFFKRVRQFGLSLSPSKTQLCRTEVTYLGHCVSSAGIRPDMVKVAAIEHMLSSPPQSKSDIRSFLGCVNYFRKFIRRSQNL